MWCGEMYQSYSKALSAVGATWEKFRAHFHLLWRRKPHQAGSNTPPDVHFFDVNLAAVSCATPVFAVLHSLTPALFRALGKTLASLKSRFS